MAGLFRSVCTVGAGLALTAGAAVLAVTTDDGRSPVLALVQPEKPFLRLVSVDVGPKAVSLAWSGNGRRYRVSLGDDLNSPDRTVVTSQPQAVIAAPKAADPHGRVNYRVEAVDGDAAEAVVEGTVTLLPAVPRRPKVKTTTAEAAAVRWKPADYATTYDVAVSQSKRKLPKKVKRLAAGGTAFATDDLKPETTYWVRVRAVGEAGVSQFGPPTKVTTPPAESTVTVGSWNICAEACSGFGGRVGAQAAKVHESQADIVALQEAGGERVGPTTKAAFSGGPRGLVPADGGGNSRYLLYAPDKVEQLAGGRWSLGHGRWATWARFEDRTTERRFFVVSVHLLNGHNSTGQRASEMRALMSALRGVNVAGDPVVLAGDFNSGTHRRGDTVGPIVRAESYRDTVEVAEQTENAQVNTGSRRGSSAIMSRDHVDHIYASPEWGVPAWKQWASLRGTTYVGQWLSDHNLITATLTLPRAGAEAEPKPSDVVAIPVEPAPSEPTVAPPNVTAGPIAG